MLLHVFSHLSELLEIIKMFECLYSASELIIDSELSAYLGQVLQGLQMWKIFSRILP